MTPNTKAGRALLDAAFAESLDDAYADLGWLASIERTPSGRALLARADEAVALRAAIRLTTEAFEEEFARLTAEAEALRAALEEKVTAAVVDALMAEEVGEGHYRWQFENIVAPAIRAALATPAAPVAASDRCVCGRERTNLRHLRHDDAPKGHKHYGAEDACHPFEPAPAAPAEDAE